MYFLPNLAKLRKYMFQKISNNFWKIYFCGLDTIGLELDLRLETVKLKLGLRLDSKNQFL